jgi:DNA topoisomerase-1
VHPHILEGYLDGTLAKALNRRARRISRARARLRPEEEAVLALLERRLAAQEKQDQLLQNPFAH